MPAPWAPLLILWGLLHPSPGISLPICQNGQILPYMIFMKIKLNLAFKRKHLKSTVYKELIILSSCLLVMNEPLFISHWPMLTPGVSGYSWSKLFYMHS